MWVLDPHAYSIMGLSSCNIPIIDMCRTQDMLSKYRSIGATESNAQMSQIRTLMSQKRTCRLSR